MVTNIFEAAHILSLYCRARPDVLLFLELLLFFFEFVIEGLHELRGVNLRHVVRQKRILQIVENTYLQYFLLNYAVVELLHLAHGVRALILADVENNVGENAKVVHVLQNKAAKNFQVRDPIENRALVLRRKLFEVKT
jgi:hypothetical protein